jgi:hypothetical protein
MGRREAPGDIVEQMTLAERPGFVASGTPTAREQPRWRAWGATASLGTTWALIAHEVGFRFEVPVLAFLAIVAASALGLSRPSVRAQVLSRGIAWTLAVPTVIAAFAIPLVDHHFDGLVAAIGATSAAAVWLSRPALLTKRARAEFDPVAYRGTFLAGAMLAVATAWVTGSLALSDLLTMGDVWGGVGLAALSAALLGSALGLTKMRAWGALLGGATSVAVVVASLFAGAQLLPLALPGLLMTLPIGLSRLQNDARDATPALRVEAEPRVRVAVPELDAADEDVAEAARPRPRAAQLRLPSA